VSPWQALLLGALQGATEFLPVSSTAHLVVAPWILGWEDYSVRENAAFTVLVQWGTLAGVLYEFRGDLGRVARETLAGIAARAPLGTPGARLGWWIALGTLPAVAAGLLLEDRVEDLQASPPWVAGFLLAGTALMLLAEARGRRDRPLASLRAADALAVGAAQALAILPGFSRSGATISGGLLRGLDRDAAARFSFLLSVPVLLAAGILKAGDLAADPERARAGALPLALGFTVAAVVGWLSIRWLLGVLRRRGLAPFVWYRVALAAVILALWCSRRGGA
jgi:undecaprenyl-diphosphatase